MITTTIFFSNIFVGYYGLVPLVPIVKIVMHFWQLSFSRDIVSRPR